MIVFNPLSDHFLFVFGNIELFGPTVSTSGEDKASVFLSFSTFTIWLSAGLFSDGGGSSDKFLPGDIGFKFRAAFSFKFSHG